MKRAIRPAIPERSDDPRVEVALTVNGQEVRRTVSVRMLLSDFLRHELGLTGTHVGCEHGVCGCCTVHIDGKAGRSCLTLAVQANGCDIRTIEDVAAAGRRAASDPAGLQGMPRSAVRLLHARHGDEHLEPLRGERAARPFRERHSRHAVGQPVPLHRLYQHHRRGSARRRAARPRLTESPHVDTHLRRPH